MMMMNDDDDDDYDAVHTEPLKIWQVADDDDDVILTMCVEIKKYDKTCDISTVG